MPSGVSQGAPPAGDCGIAGAKSTLAKFGMRLMMLSGSSVTIACDQTRRVACHRLSVTAIDISTPSHAGHISCPAVSVASPASQLRQLRAYRPAAASFHLQTELLDEIAKLDVVLVQEIRQLLGRARLSLEAARCQGVLEFGIGDHLRDVGAELADDCLGRAAGDEDREPNADVDAGQSGFRESRHVRQSL